MRLSEATVEAIKARMNIEDVVSDYVSLKRRGGRLWACCPFHSEKTPSFSVSPEMGIYKCFGCGKGGDAISFLQEVDAMGYLEALTHLAKRYGVELRYEGKTEATETHRMQQGLYAVMTFAHQYYMQQLAEDATGERIWSRYLEERGLSAAVVQAFGLGYAPADGRAFMRAAQAKGYRDAQLKEAGLLSGDGRKDFFSGRLLFPIHHLSGKVVAFGGRVLGQGMPKYLNSPETPIYQKQRVLYGLYQARKALRRTKEAYLVEGYMDLLAMVEAGFEGVVAVAGTAFTEQQAALLVRFVRRVVLIFDGDEAGQRAALRAGELLLAVGLEVVVVSLPAGMDPDDVLRKETAADFRAALPSRSKDLLTFKHQALQSAYGDSPQAQARIADELLRSLLALDDELVFHKLVKQCAGLVTLPEEVLARRLQALRTRAGRSEIRSSTAAPPASAGGAAVGEAHAHTAGAHHHEAELLILLLRYGNEKLEALDDRPTLARYVFTHTKVDFFAYPPYHKLYAYLKAHTKPPEDCLPRRADLMQLPDFASLQALFLDTQPVLSPMWQARYGTELPNEQLICKELTDFCLLRLRRALLQRRIADNLAAMQAYETEKQTAACEQQELACLQQHKKLMEEEKKVAKQLGSVIFSTS